MRLRVVLPLLTILLLPLAATAAGAYTCKVSDRVEGWNVDWYKATVTEVGTGSHEGYCYLKWDKYSSGQWISVKNIRALEEAGKAAGAASSAPPPVKYSCGVFLNGNFTYTQAVMLNKDGSYHTSTGGSGRYRYDPATKHIEFSGGSLEATFGRYEAENHQIFRLTTKEDAAKSAQAQNWRSQVCSPGK